MARESGVEMVPVKGQGSAAGWAHWWVMGRERELELV